MNKQHPLAESILNRTRAVPLLRKEELPEQALLNIASLADNSILLNTGSPAEASPLSTAAAVGLATPCGTCEDLGLAFLAAANFAGH